MMIKHVTFAIAITSLFASTLFASTNCALTNCTATPIPDPCGMVPPIYNGKISPIARIGLQQTYVFYKDGIESVVIRPGFQGKMDNFGMLIPFPTPPTLRKVPDGIFRHLDNAIDPPEVVVDLRFGREGGGFGGGGGGGFGGGGGGMRFDFQMAQNEVQVINEEAVGMYEVAVLAAGSAEALKKWLAENKFQYPEGMDKVTEEYVESGWCFVAVKTKVGNKGNADPVPGQRDVNTELPEGSVFDGHVQGMGFRFPAKQLVVPMRLSAFNEGDLRNVVYLLTDGPRRIRNIPEEYVVRQVHGNVLLGNVTKPLPLRVFGGTVNEIPEARRKQLKIKRDPVPKNGIAKTLFASDLLAVSSGNLSLELEEDEKELLAVNERLGLRGPEIDQIIVEAQQVAADKVAAKSLEGLDGMTLTLVDGDFPRQVVANQNLKFARYAMSPRRNRAEVYDAKFHGARGGFGGGGAAGGGVFVGQVDLDVWEAEQLAKSNSPALDDGCRGICPRLDFDKPSIWQIKIDRFVVTALAGIPPLGD